MNTIEKAEQLHDAFPFLAVHVIGSLLWISDAKGHGADLRDFDLRWSPHEEVYYYIAPEGAEVAA